MTGLQRKQGMVEVARKIEIILLPSKQQNLFEFGACFYLNKSFLKFSTKQKKQVSCLLFCNPLRSNLPYLNITNDLYKFTGWIYAISAIYLHSFPIHSKWRCRISTAKSTESVTSLFEDFSIINFTSINNIIRIRPYYKQENSHFSFLSSYGA